MTIKVEKASGQIEPFSTDKVRRSLHRAGAKPVVINKILANLTGFLYDGITTKEIYQQVFKLLNQYQQGKGYHYSLKQSLLRLGPSGYPFEKLVARLFTALDYKTELPDIIQGKCIQHEIDVLAVKDQQQLMIECKFHNRPGTKTRSKDVLYSQARFEDVADHFTRACLVTNTKLTSSAIKYGQCQNIKLLSWHYPNKNNLASLLDQYNLYPITAFDFLTKSQQQTLFDHDIVTFHDLEQVSSKQLKSLGIRHKDIQFIQNTLSKL